MTKLNIKTYLQLILFQQNYSVKALFTIHLKVTLGHTRGGGVAAPPPPPPPPSQGVFEFFPRG